YSDAPRRCARERGMAIVAFVVSMVILIPIVGLAIDGSVLFATKARLQAAVDGAALAGARALARGVDDATQTANAQTAAQSWVLLNFPNAYLFTSSLNVPTPTVTLSASHQRSITVTASVQSPALFEAFLGFGMTTVNASATVVRRDVNVMLVVDRSGSLQVSGSCGAVIQSATNFVQKFANGRDNVGLITFASSTYPDFPLGNTFQSASPNIATILSRISCAGSTSSAQALWQAYQQLAALNEPGALNAIVFFTDGQPTGVTVNMPITASSPCSQHPTIRGTYNVFTDYSNVFGLLADTGGPQPSANGDIIAAPNSNGCTYMSGWSANGAVPWSMVNPSDFSYLPATDIWGNSLTGYMPTTTDASGNLDVHSASNGQAVTMNAADSAATRIRSGAVDAATGNSLAGVLIFSIGLGNAAIPVSPGFLQRVSNDPNSPAFDPTQPAGIYVAAPTAADLNTAFEAVASEIMRLAK
ncbi:MAG: VWA domain-containing protein, partial [Acidobacteriaceae bacterium]|nr:VWA domain-containing protein [Acidobacteriaceae bacterium]